MMDFSLRLCPDCGARTADSLCPVDASPTVQVRKYDAGAVVGTGDIVGGRYRVENVLGRGGYGSILGARHEITGQEVALKVLKADFGGPSIASVRRFFREARVTAALVHPNTVRVFDVGQTEGGAFFIAMEKLAGPSLEDVLQIRFGMGKVLTEPEAIDVVVPVLRSLQEAHQRKLVHRDMKPANVVLADYGDGETVVKLVDFGIALTDGSSLTTSGMALGTPAYMSPEQCQAIDIDGRSDLYSLGIILYRCVTGDVPFADRNPVAIMQAHLSRPLPDLRVKAKTRLTDGFVQVVRMALEKAPDDRYLDALAMRQALDAVRRADWPRHQNTLHRLVKGQRPSSMYTPPDLPSAPKSDTAIAPAQGKRTHRLETLTQGGRRGNRSTMLSIPGTEPTLVDGVPAMLAEAETDKTAPPRR